MKRWMLLSLLACACGGSSNNGGGTPGTPHGSGSFTGSVNGNMLTVKDAVFGDPSSSLDAIIVSDQDNLCTLLAGTTFPGGKVTVLGVAIVNARVPAGPVVADTYNWIDLQGGGTLGPSLWWDGAFALPTDCNGGGQAFSPNAGTITVTQMGNTTGKTLKATYTGLTFAGATGTLNGTIEATFCAAATVAPSCGRQLLARPPSVQ